MRDSDFKPCPARSELISFKADGTKERVWRCGEQTSPHSGEFVQIVNCDECPVRAAILDKAVALKMYQPDRKADISRATKKTPDKAGSGFPLCQDRLLAEIPLCCGSSRKVWVCKSKESPAFEAEVTPVYCASCKVRRP